MHKFIKYIFIFVSVFLISTFAVSATITAKATLKSYFETGDKPSQLQFERLIDSMYVDLGAAKTVLQTNSTLDGWNWVTPSALLTDNGNIGIGTTTPGFTLQVASSTATTTITIGYATTTPTVGRSRMCWWNGENFTVEYYPPNSTSSTIATSSTCQ